MNYSAILKCDIANGTGFRTSLFVSGCARNCPGCFNRDAQDPCHGKPFDDTARELLFAELTKDYCAGLSLLGGDPMSRLSDIRPSVIALCKEVKERFPEKTIWMWTGYTFAEILADKTMRPVLDYIDMLVDGPFIEAEKKLDLVWKGSENQKVIDVAEWRRNLEEPAQSS